MEDTDLNISSLCRLCGSKTQSSDRVEIFASDDLSHQIRSLLGLDISESDSLPTFVCGECGAKLADFNEFKASSHKTDMMFREFLDNARDVSSVYCPGLSDNVAMDSVTIDEFKFEDEPEIDMSNYIPEPVISANIEQFIENDPLSFEPNSIPESASEVPPDNSNTNTQDKSLEFPSHFHLYDSQTTVQTASPNPKMQSNYLSHAVPSKHATPKDRLLGSRNETQTKKSYRIFKLKNHSNNSAAKPSKSYTGVQVQSLYATPAVKDSFSTVCILIPSSIEPNSNAVQSNLATSIKNKTPTSYKCKVCNKILKNATNFKMHMKYHNKDYSYICQYCNKGFFSNSKMQLHIRENHTKEMPFDCNKCGQKFVQRYKLRLHIEAYHIKSMNYYCKICNKSFRLERNLRRHGARVHSDVTVPIAFSCDVCSEVFDEKANLVKHISTNHQKIKKPSSAETVHPLSLVQGNEKFASTTSTQVACVEPLPLVESTNNKTSKKIHQVVKDDSRSDQYFQDSFKGNIFSRKTCSNPRKLQNHSAKNLKPAEGSNSKEITNVSEIVKKQKLRENGKNSEQRCKQLNRPQENSDSKVKRAIVKIISCPQCFILFRNVNELNFHIKHAHKFNCTYCSKGFSHDLDLQDHIKAEHTNVTIDKTCFKPGELQQHTAKELSKKQDFQCKLCPKNFNNLRNLQLHNSRIHSENRKKYICEICKDKEFFNKENLTHHINVKHLGMLYSCEFCDKTFRGIQGITAHRESKHFNSKKHVCKICNKSFAIIQYLRFHLKTHDNQRRFQCTKCLKTFKHSKTLKAHMVRNTNCLNLKKYDNKRPFKCTKCLKTFKYLKSLKRHLLRNMNCVNISEIH